MVPLFYQLTFAPKKDILYSNRLKYYSTVTMALEYMKGIFI